MVLAYRFDSFCLFLDNFTQQRDTQDAEREGTGFPIPSQKVLIFAKITC